MFRNLMVTCLAAASMMMTVSVAHAEANYTSVAEARQAEADCLAWWRTTASKLSCLDEVSDWWFHEGGNYVTYNPYTEMTRIMKIQLGMDPTDQNTVSNLAYYTFSIEVDDILQHTRTDFTDATARSFTDYESANLNTFEFYRSMGPILTLIVAHPQFGTVETKQLYYAQMLRAYNRAVAIWAATDKTGMIQTDIDFNNRSLGVTKKTLDRYVRYAH